MKMEENIISKSTSMKPSSFYKALKILLCKSHTFNKRVWGSRILHTFFGKSVDSNWKSLDTCAKLKSNDNLYNENFILSFLFKHLPLYSVSCSYETNNMQNVIELYIIEFFPKIYPAAHVYQLITFHHDNLLAWFCDITCEEYKQNLYPKFPYSLQLQNQTLILKSCCGTDSKTLLWLQETLMPRFLKWAEEQIVDVEKHICSDSLTLISINKYYYKYNELKEKYGKDMVKVWPECTDPSKFVFEDVAIATYLILLWEEDNSHIPFRKRQSFVDLGCGNGLLVYILSQEGYPGVGIDVRKRQIWNMYPGNICLEEKTITPSDLHLFPTADWIIGNHSDELTPWIPVIAARSSYKCKYFLLPCCAYNFNGTKYQRYDSAKSQYMEYLEYMKKLSEKCGFVTQTDRLKIPSTKRICLIGKKREYKEEDMEDFNLKIQSIIEGTSGSNCNETDLWISGFKPRNITEQVRNCTKISKDVLNAIIKIITKKLLEGCSFEGKWALGNVIPIQELVAHIPHDILIKLKSECGGLQTLLRNNHQIFKVQEGKVQLKYPESIHQINAKTKPKKNKKVTIKKKPCWFFNNHPQGCPHSDEECTFLHVKTENQMPEL